MYSSFSKKFRQIKPYDNYNVTDVPWHEAMVAGNGKEKNVEEKEKNFNQKICNDNKNIALVAEYKGEIVGIMCGSINSNYEHFNLEYADLIGLYIDSNFQKKGIASNFKAMFEDWARKNGASKYVIGVLKDNKKARAVYEKWGGKLSTYEEDFYKMGVAYKEVFYIYDL